MDAGDLAAAAGAAEAIKAACWVRLLRPTAPSAPSSDVPYSLDEAATLLGKSATWVRRRAAAGALPCARKVGRSWVFPRADFDRLRARRHVG